MIPVEALRSKSNSQHVAGTYGVFIESGQERTGRGDRRRASEAVKDMNLKCQRVGDFILRLQ
jgi:hypothetical protein